MIALEEEFFQTIRPFGKGGVRIKARWYHTIKQFIFDLLKEEKEMRFSDFVTKLHTRFVGELGDNAGWLVYQVKLDLEARGLIGHMRINKSGERYAKVKMLPGTIQKAVHAYETQMCSSTSTVVNDVVKSKFLELYKTNPLIVHSPGRINLIGEHTDYNNGFVMPAAIDKGIQIAVAPSEFDHSLIYSVKYDAFYSVDITRPEKVSSPVWVNYLLGILYQFNSRGLNIGNFNCVFDGDLPTGAGLSSSAAMECGFVFSMNELFKLNLSKLDMIHIAQWAEHNYVGVKCGIMDQFTSMMGKENHVMVLDCQWLSYDYYPLDLGDYCLLLCDTNVKHALSSSEYNLRRQECEEGVRLLKTRFPEIGSLRDVTRRLLIRHKDLFPEKIFNRCLYVVEENSRVLRGSRDLKLGKLAAFGEKMFATHKGLSTQYEVSCPELDFLVSKASAFQGVLGSRMMGGGFGGCTINIVHRHVVDKFLEDTRASYREKFGIEMTSYLVKTGNGTSVVDAP